MLLLRIAAILAALVIGSSIVAYLFSRDRKYLRLAGLATKWAVYFVLFILCLMVLERLIVR